MVFTLEPGAYISKEKIGIRIECDFLVTADGKLADLDASLPHTAVEIEAAMQPAGIRRSKKTYGPPRPHGTR